MYIEIHKLDFKEIEKITSEKYKKIELDNTVLINQEELDHMLEDLRLSYRLLEEEFDDYKNNENQEEFNPYEEYGISESDFH